MTFWPHSFVEAKLQGLVTLAASPEQKWQDFLNKIVGKHILRFFLGENSGTKIMANWAKQSLFASGLHWLRVILNRLLLGQRGPFLIFLESWFMALHGSVFVFFSPSNCMSNPRKEEVQAKLEKAIGEAVKVEKSTSKLSQLLHDVHPSCLIDIFVQVFVLRIQKRWRGFRAKRRYRHLVLKWLRLWDIARLLSIVSPRHIHLQCT